MRPDADKPRTILITGAAGNLGSILARHLAGSPHRLRLMTHKKPLPSDLLAAANVEEVRADLARPETLEPAARGVDSVVHFAGVLFAPRPDRFLPVTNTRWFANLLDACLAARVERVVLVSFPHVEGPTTPERPATGRLDGKPVSVHARTRLEEERLLFARTQGSPTAPVSLRLGMVYGRGILMVEAARWLARHRLLGVWREPTSIHLISTEDYLRATAAAAIRPGIRGIYHVGDERPITLQEFLDGACRAWGVPPPRRLPFWMVRLAAALCELGAGVLGTRAWLTRDFVEIGRVSYWGDTRRAREELAADLAYPTFEEGKATLGGCGGQAGG
ncbi:MAG: NAD-dependent epimerase/dehydratase family protein [Planctomycetes bacterium]|nr:NAD-dependent epimerase/dehydratase family protein [Planctomycetota bacterium]